jgi:hypothetical protein
VQKKTPSGISPDGVRIPTAERSIIFAAEISAFIISAVKPFYNNLTKNDIAIVCKTLKEVLN